MKAIQYSTIGSLESCRHLAEKWAGNNRVGMVTRVGSAYKASQWSVEALVNAFKKDADLWQDQKDLALSFGVQANPDSLDLGEVEIVFGKNSWLDLGYKRVCVGTPNNYKWTAYDDCAEAIREGVKQAQAISGGL